MMRNLLLSFKKIGLGLALLVVMLVMVGNAWGATYYSRGSLAPNLTTSWAVNTNGTGTQPTNFTTAGDVFIVQTGHTMTASNTWTIGLAANTTNASKLQINNGGTLAMSNRRLTLASCNFTNAGTFSSTTGGVTISGTLDANTIAGFTTTGAITFSKTGGTATLQGNVNAASLAFTSANNATLDLNGNTITVTGTTSLPRPSSAPIILAVGSGSLITGALTLSGSSSGRNTVVTVSSGTVTVTGNFTAAGTGNPGGSRFTFSGAGTLNVGGSGTNAMPQTTNALNFTASTSTVNYTATGDQTIGNHTYNNLTLSGSGLKTENTATVNSVLSMEGTASASAAPTYGSSATLQYKGSSTQTPGPEFTNSFNGTGGIIIDNENGVTLGSAESIGPASKLTLLNGILTTSATNLLSVTNTSSSAISGGSANSFISGPVRWTLPTNLPSGSTYSFPVGMGTTYLPFTLEDPITGTGTTTAQVEAFAVNSGGSIDATLDSKSSTEYWSLTISGNFTNSSVSVDRGSAISPYDVVAGSSSQSGTYTSLEGTASATGVSGSDPIETNRFFVLAERKRTITTSTVSTAPFCITSTISASGTVAFTSIGAFSSATFTARLSDASGSFASPVNIGTATVTGNNPSGTINITIPAGTVSGTGYKIRIDCSSPAITGSESSAFTVVNGVSNVTSFSASDDDASSSLSWTNPTECYDEVLIVAKANSSVTGTPTGNGSAYIANLNFGSGTSFGGGYVVYKGTSSPQTISGLTNGTTYYLKAYTRSGNDWSSGVEITANPSSASLATDYFRSKTSGDWASASTWESSHDGTTWINATLYPTSSANSILIQVGHTVFAQTSPSSNNLTVNGTYEHRLNGGTIPAATWAANSTCLVTGMKTTSPTGLSQPFGNFTWNCTEQTGGLSTTGNIVVSGNFTLESGTFALNNVTGYSLTIEGNYNQTGGVFDFNRGDNSGQGIIYIAGNFTNTSATSSSITTNGNNAPNGKIIFNGNGVQTLNIPTAGSAQWVKYEVNAGSFVELTANLTLSSANTVTQLPYVGEFTVNGTIDFGGFTMSQSGGIAGSSIFTLNSGAKLITSNSSGISGSISSTNMNSVLSSGANYEFQGANTGTFLTTPDAGTVNDLIVNRSGGVTLSQSIAVGGNLIFTSGFLNSTTSNLISVTNTSSSAISGASATSFINGPMRWTLPASLASGSTYSFPVGEGTNYMPFTLKNPTTGTGTTTAQVEAFAANSGGSIDATLDSKSSTEYWSLTTSGNFSNSSVSVDRGSAISPYDIIAGASSQSGTYTSLEGTAGATGVSNSDLIGSHRFFVLAEKKKNTITTGTISGSPFCQGATFSVPFTISGTYNSGNIFTAQLSDASGSFSSPVAIGSLTSTGAGIISATIPSGASGGTGYRIRVVSSNPSVTGSDNGSNIAINVIPSAPLIGTIVQPTCDVATGSVTLNGLPSGNWTVTMNPGGVKTTGTGSSATITNLAPGTYSFTVTGEDESTACPGSGNGLKGEYFNVMDLSGTPVLTRTDATVNFNWGTGTPGSPVNVNVFSVRWSGKVQACYTENYTFTTRSDDGVRLSVNGNQIINNWTDHSATNNSGNILLVAGQKYDIVLEFYENGGDAVSQLSWSSPSQPTSVIIPQSQLYSEATGCSSVASANVVINAQPAVPAAPTSVTPSSATSVCLGESVNLNATSAGNTIYWFTQASGGTTIGSSNSGENFSVSPSVNTTYYAETRSSSGCISATRTATGLITVTSGLSAVVLSPSSQQNICIDGSGSQITVTETNGGTISARQWGKRSVSGGAITAIAGATGANYTPAGADLGAGTWYLVCTSSPTCGSAMTSNEITIVVSESIGGTVSGGVTPACLGSSIGTLTLTGYTGTIKNWEKRVDGGSWSYITNTTATYSETPGSAGTWQYRAVVQNGSCNVANSSEISIVVDPVSVGGGVYDGTTPICLNSSTGTMNLRAGYVGNVVRWEKRVDGGAWSNIANTSTSYSENPSVPGTWEYRALVQSGSCTAVYSTAFSVVVNPELTITLGTNPSVCQTTTSTTIPYSATSGNPADWVLTFNAAAISAGFSNPQNGSLASSPGNIPVNVPYDVAAGVYQANLKLIKYTPSCSSVDYPVTITVSAGQSASVTIAASSNPVCSGTSITYTATPTNGGTSPTYQWKVNGTNAGTNSPTYSYTPANGDVVTCVLTSSETCASGSPATSNSVTMTVNVLPTASISGTTTVCPNAASPAIIFTGSGSSAPYTFTYKINGGSDLQVTTTSGNTVTVNAPTATSGDFIYSLVSASDASGCSQAQTGEATVTVRPQMTVSTDAPAQLCQHTIKMVTATVSGGSGNYTYSWQVITPGASTLFIPGSTTSDFIWLTGFSLSPANYEYRLTVTDTSWGCVKTFDYTVTILPNQNTNWVSNPSSACVGQTGAIYSVQNTAGTTYAWTVSGGTIAEGQGTSQIKVNWGSSSGSYEVSLTTTTGTCTQTFSQSVTVSSLPTINLGNNPAVCSGTVTASLNYSATTGSPNRYSIDYDATANSAGFVDVVNASLLSSAITLSIPAAATPAVYNGTLSVNNSGVGCESISYPITVTINTNLPVSISIAANTNPVCAGSGVTFTATPVNGGSTPEFQWKVNGNDVGTNSTTYSYIPGNGDVVTCRLTSDVNCATGNPATSNTITMTVNPIPAVTNSPTKTICNGSSTNISLTATTASNFSWTIGTITGGITGASAGSGSNIDQILTNPSNSSAGSVQYIVTPTSLSGTCVGSPFTITVTVQSINALVSDISDEVGSDCPDFGDFNPNTASYNPGYSVVKFRVERDLSSSAWNFDYNLTGGVVYSGSPEVASATKSIAVGTGSVDMVFYVANTPGAAQNIVFKVVNVSDSNCSNNGINRTVTHTISAMPAIGSFN